MYAQNNGGVEDKDLLLIAFNEGILFKLTKLSEVVQFETTKTIMI